MSRCAKRLKESCEDIFDTVDCEAATRFCESELSDPFFRTGLYISFLYLTLRLIQAIGKNPYDLSKDCEGGSSHTSCYPMTKYGFVSLILSPIPLND